MSARTSCGSGTAAVRLRCTWAVTGRSPPDSRAVLLGGDVAGGQQPQVLIPAGTWQSAAPAADQPVLVSCVVAPGFDFADFRLA